MRISRKALPLVKLVIWDLDDTLWRGTLADGEAPVLFAQRADLIRRLNQHGVLSSICSKNDFAAARKQLEAFGLWDAFVFPRIAFAPKGEAIAALLSDMQLRAADTLFVDDNVLNLDEARHRLPDLRTLDSRDANADAVLAAILTDQPASRNRVAEYRQLEQKQADRQASGATDDADFLRSCQIRVCGPSMMSNLDFADRIVELINRSNQLNYTQSRTTVEELTHDLTDAYLDYICCSIFAWDRYGEHGLVGFAMIHRRTQTFKHLVFSCRIMHMGIERFTIERYFRPLFPGVVVPDDWQERLRWSEVDWIEDLPFKKPEIRQAVFAAHGRAAAAEPVLRVMCACQSGGIAHYSAHRDAIDFDLFPRLFTLSDFAQGEPEEELPPYIVYGAGIDYKDEAWPEALVEVLDEGLYSSCVMLMAAYLTRRGSQALIFLPPENLAESLYNLPGVTRMRVLRYNDIWREAAGMFPCLSIVGADEVCTPEEMVDVNHHRPAALQTISALVDVWFEAVSAVDEALPDAA